MKRACNGCGVPVDLGKGTRCPACSKPKRSSWSPNRDHKLHKRFARAVVKRDKKCQLCGTTENLTAHHTVPLDADNAYSTSAGVTVCRDCHKAVDRHAR
jgi:5-methylcytosine-specific restriction endonuclease McrA